jgi:hypothetical protein
MDEFGPAFRRISKFRLRKGIDAPAASVSCFQYCHSRAGASEFAGGHQACGTCADDDGMS